MAHPFEIESNIFQRDLIELLQIFYQTNFRVFPLGGVLVEESTNMIGAASLNDYESTCDSLVGVIQKISLAHSAEEVMRVVRIAARELTGADGTTFVLRDGEFPGAYDHPGGWTWATRIVDLDNDGWQDIFNSEGVIRKNSYGWNVFLKNFDGTRFEPKQFSLGLVDDFGLYSFSLLDFDHDGDLDIIGNSAEGPVQVYVNNHGRKTIAVSLEAHSGNRLAIGAKIIVTSDSQSQIREIKASGGYQSFDPPIAYFGLGDAENVSGISVQWPDGKRTEIQKSLATSKHYKIRRLN